MARRVEFVSYRPKTVLNKHKRPDRWFWTRYTAYPYKGCMHGREICCCKELKYHPFGSEGAGDDPDAGASIAKQVEPLLQGLMVA